MNKEAKKRGKIFLLFFAGIVLPSLVMGYLAYRGIQNDRALMENRLMEENRRFCRSAVKDMNDALSRTEEAFQKLLKQRSGEALEWNEFKQSHPVVEEIFLIEDRTRIIFPQDPLLFKPDSDAPHGYDVRDSELNSIMDAAEEKEFQEKNFSEAEALYRKAFSRGRTLEIKGMCLSAAARVLRKGGRLADARALYEKTAKEYGGAVTPGGIPLGLASRMERAGIYMQEGQPEKALKIWMDTYKGLLEPEWSLDRPGYENYSAQLQKSIQSVLEDGDSHPEEEALFLKLKNREEHLVKKTERLLVFRENASPGLRGISGPFPRRTVWDAAGRSYLVSIAAEAGMIFSRERLAADIISPALKGRAPSEDLFWRVKDSRGSPVIETESMPSRPPDLETGLNGVFPGWTLILFRKNPAIFESFISNPSGVYFYMFLLIGGILTFGLVLTVRLVNRELELSRMKSDFVSTVSHEFKSPLTSIRQLSEMLHSGRVPTEERRRRYYDVLLRESERLSLLTENVLNFSRMEEGRKRFHFEKTDVSRLLRETAAGFQERLDDFSIILEAEENLPPVFLDRDSFRQAVNNLIDNAVKYSGGSRRAVVRARTEENELAVSVQDFGSGIPPGEQRRIFDRFYRGGGELTRKVKGSGLGLTLVKQIMDAHRGKAEVESEPGKGSIFTLRLPLEIKREGQ